LIGALVTPFLFWEASPEVVLFVAALDVLAASHLCAPPLVLLLGPSRRELEKIVWECGLAVLPGRFVHLLEPPGLDSATAPVFGFDSIRTYGEGAWRSIVHELSDWVPIVVVETRVTTRLLVEEVRHMLSPTRWPRALFVVGPQGEHPAIDMALGGAGLLPPIMTATSDRVAPLLKRLSRNCKGAGARRRRAATEFINLQFGFRISIPAGWEWQPLHPKFVATGGQIEMRNEHNAMINVACGPPDERTPVANSDRLMAAERFVATQVPGAGAAPLHTDTQPFAGEWNTVRVEARLFGGFHGIVSAIHNGTEFVIHYRGDAESRAEVEEVLSTFSFAA
jgi:hypothetical protein